MEMQTGASTRSFSPTLSQLMPRPIHLGSPIFNFRLGTSCASSMGSDVHASWCHQSPWKSGGLIKTLELGLLFGLWYLFNIYFNIYNKQVLKVYQYPATVSAFQFAVGTVFVIFMWIFNLYKRPYVSPVQLLTILPLALVHKLGNLFTNMILGKAAVSFTHTIKVMVPFFSVVLSAMFLGEMPTAWVVASLVPIVSGVALASVIEASFNWPGFWSAMVSNLANHSRNVLSKKIMIKKEMACVIPKGILAGVTFLLLCWNSVQAQDLGDKAGFTEHDAAAASFTASSPSPSGAYSTSPPIMLLASTLMLYFLHLML